MGFVKGNDGIASTLRNTLEGSVGNIALENISAVTLTSTANVTGGNLITAGQISATSTITSAANISGGNIATAGQITAGGNVTSGNVSVTGNVTAGNLSIGTITTTGNITFAGDSSSAPSLNNFNVNAVSITATAGNLAVINGGAGGESGGFISATRGISATANITGGNILTAGLISATSTITSAANVVGGNITTAGLITATANITGGNILTAGIVSATSNIQGGNLRTAGLISATANITGGNLIGIYANGTSNISIPTISANILFSTAGNANVLVIANTGIVANVLAATTATPANGVGYIGLPQNATGNATLTIVDAGKHIYVTSASQTITIPANSSVAYPIGTAIAFIAGPSATTVSIAITSDTMYLAGTGTTGTRTLAAYGMATAVKVAATTWYINGSGLT